MDLDVMDPTQVVGHKVIKADLGAEGRSMMIISGIACPEWRINDDDHTYQQTCRVRLRQSVADLEESSVHVGLASISNEDTEWVFSTDQATLQLDDSQELVLVTNLALRGAASYLHRFSYQIVVTTRAVATEIMGSVTWPTAVFRPASTDPAPLASGFTITAFDTSGPTLTPVASGAPTSVSIADVSCAIVYTIDGAPTSVPLLIAIESSLLSPLIIEPTGPNLNVLTLNAGDPIRSGIDFVARKSQVDPA